MLNLTILPIFFSGAGAEGCERLAAEPVVAAGRGADDPRGAAVEPVAAAAQGAAPRRERRRCGRREGWKERENKLEFG